MKITVDKLIGIVERILNFDKLQISAGLKTLNISTCKSKSK